MMGIRCALKVPEWTARPSGATASMTSRRPAKALRTVPPPRHLPSVVRSGVTPRYACAHPGPVRKPERISSKMRTTPYRAVSSRTRSGKPGSGRIVPEL